MLFYSENAAQTMEIAEKLAANSKTGAVICINGDLGAGKTVFAQGFARGLGVQCSVTSPTFGILNIYGGLTPLYHFDVYRIRDISEMEDTGYEEYFYGDGVCIIEWAEKIRPLIPGGAVWIEISKDFVMGLDYRVINICNGGFDENTCT